jgi:ABC-type multidrug transport system fused ATPase/permease subunit
MSDDNNWDNMMTEWQSCKIAKVDTAKDLEDIKILETKTRRKERSMKFFMWGDIIGAVIITLVFGYYLLFKDNALFLKVLFGGSLVIVLPMTFLSIWYRKGAWSASGNDTHAYLELALTRSVSAIKLAKATAITAILAGVFIVSALVWQASVEYQVLPWPWNRFVFGISFEAIFFGSLFIGSKWYEKRRLKEKLKLESMLNELDSE